LAQDLQLTFIKGKVLLCQVSTFEANCYQQCTALIQMVPKTLVITLDCKFFRTSGDSVSWISWHLLWPHGRLERPMCFLRALTWPTGCQMLYY